MVEYSQTHGAQPGEPPIDDGAPLDFEHGDSGVEQSADEQPNEPPQQMPNTSNASSAAAGSRRSRGDERDRGYLLQPVAILASEFYGEASAKELFPQIWRRHLIRGKVVAFVRGSSVESDKWNAIWSDDGSTLMMKSSKVEVAMALEARNFVQIIFIE